MEHSQSHKSVPTVASTSSHAFHTCVFFSPCRKRIHKSLRASSSRAEFHGNMQQEWLEVCGVFILICVFRGNLNKSSRRRISAVRLHQQTQNSQMFIQKHRHFSKHKKERFGGLVSAKLSCTTSMLLPRPILSLFNSGRDVMCLHHEIAPCLTRPRP